MHMEGGEHHRILEGCGMEGTSGLRSVLDNRARDNVNE
jgi:hypothetical protein